MAAPRRVVPGKTYLITRRCYQRTFRLRPSERTNRLFLYCLALAAAKTGVVLHAVCVMSNHHHIVLTDVRGVFPDFLRELHRMTAKALNASQGQWENLWSAEPTNVVLLVDPEDVLRKIAYVVANPVDAGLVEKPAQWPGVLLWGESVQLVARPDDYFDPFGKLPKRLELVVAAPGAAGVVAGWEKRLDAEIAALVAKAHRSMEANGMRFLGRAAVLAASFMTRARSYEVKRGVVPRIAALNREVRAETVRVFRRFHGAYAVALEAWRAGERAAVFPAGTWWMGVHHGARVEPLADAA